MNNILGFKISDSQYPQMKIIETPRFIFRPATINDVKDIYEYLSQKKVVKYLPFNAHKNINTTKKFIRSFFINNYKNGKVGNYVAYYKRDKKVVGNIGINNMSTHSKSAELGICINPNYWGNNWALEFAVISLISGFEFNNFERLTAITYTKNKYSTKCLDDLNFRHVKTTQPKRNFPAYHIYEIKRDEYLKLKKQHLPNIIKSFY